MPNVPLSSTALWLKPISVAALIVDMMPRNMVAVEGIRGGTEGDLRGIRGGSTRDPRGILCQEGGSTLFRTDDSWGIRRNRVQSFIILKLEDFIAWGYGRVGRLGSLESGSRILSCVIVLEFYPGSWFWKSDFVSRHLPWVRPEHTESSGTNVRKKSSPL